MSSTERDRAEPPALVIPRPDVVIVDGQEWHVCPLAGAGCMRVAATLARDWAADVIAVHIALHHRTWR